MDKARSVVCKGRGEKIADGQSASECKELLGDYLKPLWGGEACIEVVKRL